MRQIVKDQLNKISIADLSNYDSLSNTYFIKKYTGPRYTVGNSYIIQIANELINNKDSIITTNWNQGRVLKSKYYKAYITKTNGNMIYFDGLAYDYDNRHDLNEFWSGWVPIEGIKQLAILDGGNK